MEETFDEIDLNGGGIILFDEFCAWALKKGMKTEQSRKNDAAWQSNKLMGDDEFSKVKIKTS